MTDDLLSLDNELDSLPAHVKPLRVGVHFPITDISDSTCRRDEPRPELRTDRGGLRCRACGGEAPPGLRLVPRKPPYVANMRRERFDVRIDRATVWGNPFRVGTHGDRTYCISEYRKYILSKPDLIARAKSELRGKILGCWCKPAACHGDVLLEIANG